jgi:hypothetical protein
MHNISTLEEARDILAKDELSPEDVKELLLYLVGRDEVARQSYGQVGMVLNCLMQASVALIKAFTVIGVSDEEVRARLLDARQSIDDVLQSLKDDSLIH